jgi:hypothetical protein
MSQRKTRPLYQRLLLLSAPLAFGSLFLALLLTEFAPARRMLSNEAA